MHVVLQWTRLNTGKKYAAKGEQILLIKNIYIYTNIKKDAHTIFRGLTQWDIATSNSHKG